MFLWRNVPDESRLANCAGCGLWQYSLASSSIFQSGSGGEEAGLFRACVCVCVCVFLPFDFAMSHVRVDEIRFKSCLLQGSLKQKKNTLKKLKEIDAIEALD